MASFAFIVNGQNFELIEDEAHVSDSVRYLDASFSFDERWSGLRKFLIFEKGSESYKVEIVDNRIRPESNIVLSDGPWKVSVIGEKVVEDDLVKRITTDPKRIIIKRSGIKDGDPFPGITPSIGEQIVNRAAAEAEQASYAAGEATQAAGSAEQAAGSAAGYAQTARTNAVAAETYAVNASRKAVEAEKAANNAKEIEQRLHEKVAEYVSEHKEELKGDPGYTPIKGIDYFDGEPGEPGKEYDDTELRAEISSQNENIAKQLKQELTEYTTEYVEEYTDSRVRNYTITQSEYEALTDKSGIYFVVED